MDEKFFTVRESEEVYIELDEVKNLLGIFTDFYNNECPMGELPSEYTSSDAFATRTMQYISAVNAAQDKIIALLKKLGAATDAAMKAISAANSKAGDAI